MLIQELRGHLQGERYPLALEEFLAAANAQRYDEGADTTP